MPQKIQIKSDLQKEKSAKTSFPFVGQESEEGKASLLSIGSVRNQSWPYLRLNSDISGNTLLAMICLLLALFPLSVYLVDGLGEQFNISLFLYIGIVVFGLTALILTNYIVLYYIFAGLAFLCYGLGFYHALREIIRNS